ncbi:CARDB domain-containing protein, partial [Chloroflexota bacterium]
SGYTSTTFTYSVNYTDFENDAPSWLTIIIDGSTSENMTVKTGEDGDFTNSEIYEYSTTGANLGVGTHTFQFAANDSTNNATGDIGSHSGPTISSTTVLSPTPVAGGGGGGGGGLAGVTSVLYSMNQYGRFTEDVTANSEDRKAELYISQDTIGKNRVGSLLSSIYIREMEDPPTPPAQRNTVGLVYNIGPDGATFDPPIDLSIRYDASLLPQGIAEKNLVVAKFESSTSQWEELESVVDPKADAITAKVSHFCAFTVLTPTQPASFNVSDLSVTPNKVDFEESVSISILITNTGDLTGSYEVSLKIDDKVPRTKEITLDGGDSKTVSFSVSPDTAGKHTVNISGLWGTFEVAEHKSPAAFTTSALSMSAAEVDIGEDITISILVTNTGDLIGSYKVTLNVDSVDVAIEDVTLAGGASQKVVFSIAKDIAKTYTVKVDDLSEKFTVKPPPAQAAFTISDLNISPVEVDIGEDITISVLGTNTGDLTGSYKVTLNVDNVDVAIEDVTLAGGASQKVVFSIAKDIAKTYTVKIDDLSGKFTVKPPPTPALDEEKRSTETPVPTKPNNRWLIVGIIAGAVLLGLALYFWIRKPAKAR